MKRTLRIISCLLTAVSWAAGVHAADNDGTIRIPRPGREAVSLPVIEADAVVRHVDHAVDLSTGNANISYTLCTLDGMGISLPVTMSYQTGGLKYEQESGVIGMGWTLDWGGHVSREVRGRPDGSALLQVTATRSEEVEYLKDITDLKIDPEYDIYTYKAGPYTGRFIIKGGEVLQLPRGDAEIAPTASGFDITAPDGTLYRFEPGETVKYQFNPVVVDPSVPKPDYTATVSWRLRSIVNATRTDSITVTYKTIENRHRSRGAKLLHMSVTETDGTPSKYVTSYDKSASTNRYEYTNRTVPSVIRGSMGEIRLSTTTMTATLSDSSTSSVVTLVSEVGLYAPGVNKPLVAAELSYVNRHNILLKEFSVKSGNSVAGGAAFEYHGHTATHGQRDFFGFHSKTAPDTTKTTLTPITQEGFEHQIFPAIPPLAPSVSDSQADPCESVLDQYLNLSRQRTPDFDTAMSDALCKITSAAGTVTTLTYEPNKCRLDLTAFTIGLRIKSETVEDLTTGNVRRRDFTYEGSVPSVDLSKVHSGQFISLSGNIGSKPIYEGSFNMQKVITTSATWTASCRLPGLSPESAVVYHSKVTETLSGTGIELPIVTTHEYDTSETVAPFVQAGSWSEYQVVDKDRRVAKFSGLADSSSSGQDKPYGYIFQPHPVTGYFREMTGEKAPLVRTVEFRTLPDGTLEKRRITERKVRRVVTDSIPVGFFCESMVRTNSASGNIVNDFKSAADFQRFPITLRNCQTVCDSVIVTERDDNGVTRTVATAYAYPGISGGKGASYSFPFRITSLCGGESVSLLTAMPVNLNTVLRKTELEWPRNPGEITPLLSSTLTEEEQQAAAAAKTQKRYTLPIYERYEAAGFAAEKRYAYSPLTNGSLALSAEVLHAGSGKDKAPEMERLDIYSRDPLGRPTLAVYNRGPEMAYTWRADRLQPSSVSVGGLLTTEYTLIGLAGPSVVTDPAGNRTHYGYEGRRLKSATSPSGAVTTYDYAAYVPDGHNALTATSPAGVARSRYDGFGNVIAETVAPRSGGGEITSANSFDALGRVTRAYAAAPVAVPSPGADPDEWAPESLRQLFSAAHGGDSRPYAETVYRSGTAGGDDVSSTLAGEEFAGHPSKSRRLFNEAKTGSAEGVLTCRRYSGSLGNADGRLRLDGYYPEGSLTVTETTDADGRKAYVFADFRGRKLLTRTLDSGGRRIDTYYVHDDADNLIFALQPMASASLGNVGGEWSWGDETLRRFAFSYFYDDRMLLTKEVNPGTEPIEYRRDAAGNVIFRQDGNQRERGEVAFALPDQCGRPALSGVCHESALNGSVRDSVVTVRYVGWWGDTYTGENVIAGYATALSLPYPEISEVNYYDDYSFLEIESAPAITDLAAALEARGAVPARDNNTGLLTGRLTGVPDPDFYGNGGERSAATLASAILYDSASRPSRTIETGLDGTVSDETVTYSVTDKPLTRRVAALSVSGDTLGAVSYAYAYDGLDRLVRTEASVGGVTKTLAEDAYDTFGRLTSTRLGPGAAAVSYGYATRGALKSISAPRFSQTLLYTEGEIPCYGGNISASLWRGLDGISRRYDYSYDPSGRLVKADYTESGRDPDIYKLYRSIPDYSAYYTYDLNSNPATTYRYGVQDKSSDDECVYLRFGLVDDLVFHREGNRLTAVVDDGSSAWYVGATDFADDQTDADEYLYDANGNMTYDLNRGVESITYNDLNLPAVITMKDGETIRNHYDAAGRLLRRQTLTNPASGSPSHAFAPVLQEDEETFIGGFIFNTGSGGWRLRQINTPTGYMAADGGVYSFVRDYQGNVRQVVNERGGVVQESDYYPYGMLFGESDVSGSRSEANRYRYGGKEYLAAAGLNLYDQSARYYDPATLQFGSADPITDNSRQMSQFAFCNANPINYVDPTGCDGMAVGNGTIDDPHVVKVVVCYDINKLPDKILGYLQEAASIINGQKIEFKENGMKKNLKYDVSLQGMEDLANYRNSDYCFSDATGTTRYFSNMFNTVERADDKYGYGNSYSIELNMANIKKGIEQGFDERSLIVGTILHEMAHNLGALHEYGTSMMKSSTRYDIRSQLGHIRTTFDYPTISTNLLKIIFLKHDTPKVKYEGRIYFPAM